MKDREGAGSEDSVVRQPRLAWDLGEGVLVVDAEAVERASRRTLIVKLNVVLGSASSVGLIEHNVVAGTRVGRDVHARKVGSVRGRRLVAGVEVIRVNTTPRVCTIVRARDCKRAVRRNCSVRALERDLYGIQNVLDSQKRGGE